MGVNSPAAARLRRSSAVDLGTLMALEQADGRQRIPAGPAQRSVDISFTCFWARARELGVTDRSPPNRSHTSIVPPLELPPEEFSDLAGQGGCRGDGIPPDPRRAADLFRTPAAHAPMMPSSPRCPRRAGDSPSLTIWQRSLNTPEPGTDASRRNRARARRPRIGAVSCRGTRRCRHNVSEPGIDGERLGRRRRPSGTARRGRRARGFPAGCPALERSRLPLPVFELPKPCR